MNPGPVGGVLKMPGLVGDLLALGLELEETHISWVFLGKQEVWKVKKPVEYGFLSYGSRDKRKHACDAEIELNRRFSPDVYLGVVPVVIDPQGRHRLGGTGETVDWAVHMIRLPESDRADRRLESERLPIAWLKSLAEQLAAFHAAARSDAWTAQFGSPAALAGNLEETLGQSGSCLSGLLGPHFAAGLESRLNQSLLLRSDVIKDRMHAGRVRDGHGDLRLNQIYFDDGGRARILDCIEFNDRFRYGDVCSDISFLSMDLSSRGRRDLAENFLAAYARASGDFELYALVDYFEGYRACVRGKVACLRAEDPGSPEPECRKQEEEARRHFLFALSVAGKRNEGTPVIAVGGNIATGKSTLAERLGESLGAPVIGSDLTRKQMAGLAPTEKRRDGLYQGLYAQDNTEKVYAEVFRRARMAWESGRPVVVDASFRSAGYRKALRAAAAAAGCIFFFMECRTDESVCRDRLRGRARSPAISDADEGIFDQLREKYEPVTDEIPSGDHMVLDTGRPLEVSLEESLVAVWRRWR